MKIKNVLRLSFWALLTVFALSCAKDSDSGPDSPDGGGGGGIGGIGGIGGGGGTGGDGGGTGGDDGGGGGGGTSTKTASLTGKQWMLGTVTIDPGVTDQNGQMITDVTFLLNACFLDNIYKWNTDYSYKIDEGATKCNANDPQILESGTWAWSNNETQLSLTTDDGTYTVNIPSITATELKMSFQDQIQYEDGSTSTHQFTYIFN